MEIRVLANELQVCACACACACVRVFVRVCMRGCVLYERTRHDDSVVVAT